jgi:hypothetical protein
MPKKVFPLLLIFLLAFALRVYRLAEIPPGLTHDEANHGREAIGILDGVFLFYFPLNYGSEPLYSYTVAGSMLAFGINILALRLVNVVFGLATIGLTYLWLRWAFDRRTGLLAAGLMAISFWPLASSREALRAGMLPFFMAGAVWFFWHIISCALAPEKEKLSMWNVAGFAVCLAATLHIYLAARVAWTIFPIFMLYLAFTRRKAFGRSWLPVLIGLVAAGLFTVPMFVYLQNHPEALTRLAMLDQPLREVETGNWRPVLKNVAEALLAFTWPGYGDAFLAYNIPGRPVFDAVTAALFIIGLFVVWRHWRRPAYAFLLIWFGIGILPSLLTGPTANTTRNVAAMPAIYALPAIGFIAVANRLSTRFGPAISRPLSIGAVSAWLLLAGWVTARDYFIHWAESPEVRGAYQHTLVEALAYLQEMDARQLLSITTPVVISSVYPGPAHDPSISLVMLPDHSFALRWIDARYALLLPQAQDAWLIIPASTPLHPAFAGWLQPVETISLREDDLDPSFTLYHFRTAEWDLAGPAQSVVDFDGALHLRQARWLAPAVHPGATAELLTVWQVVNPSRVGPIGPPLYTTDAVVFTHVLDKAGGILAQRDALEAPSWAWQPGDVVVQIHPVYIPPQTAPGVYQTAVGVYDRVSGERRPVVGPQGDIVDSRTFVAPLQVSTP